MLYGDDPLKLNNYTYAPSLAAIIQSGNLYVYAMSNPTRYTDPDGEFAISAWIAKNGIDILANTAVSAIATGIAYHSDGKSVVEGVLLGAASGAVSAVVDAILGKDTLRITRAVTASIGEYWRTSGGEIDQGALTDAIISGVVAGVAGKYFTSATKITSENDYILELMPTYTQKFGDNIELFFNGIMTAVLSKEYEG